MPAKKKEEEKEEGLGKFEFADGSFYEGRYIVKRDAPGDAPPVANKRSSTSNTPNATAVPDPNAGCPLLQNGVGVYQDCSGSLYDGQWAEGKASGNGTLSFPSGGRYTGGFAEGKYHGIGRYVWPDGSYYEGEWESGLIHGSGTYVDVLGRRWQGKFSAGEGVDLQTEQIF